MADNIQYMIQTSHDVLRGVGRRLRARRMATDLTQSQLAKRAGVSRPTVVRMESGGNVGVEPLVRVAMVLEAAGEFNALFPPADSRSLDEILAEQRRPQRVRHRTANRNADLS
jgi:transcriptional regulator with XRE-family HTH domain